MQQNVIGKHHAVSGNQNNANCLSTQFLAYYFVGYDYRANWQNTNIQEKKLRSTRSVMMKVIQSSQWQPLAIRCRDVREWLATFPFPPIPISSFPFP